MSESEHEQRRDVVVAGFFAALIVTTVGAFTGLTVIFSWGFSLMLILAAALGAMRDGRLGPFRWWLAAALVAWVVLFALLHGLSNDPADPVLGFTAATAAAVYGLWLAPLLLVTLPYAWHFHGHVLDERALEDIREFAERRVDP